jgi:hypothetical protein
MGTGIIAGTEEKYPVAANFESLFTIGAAETAALTEMHH